jgi:hypothetical protein
MNLENIISVEQELIRFQKRIQEAKKRFKEDNNAEYGCKESGALRRGALDLKNELTRLTR